MGSELPPVLRIGTQLSFSNTFFFPPFWDLAFLPIFIFDSLSTLEILLPLVQTGAFDLASQASFDLLIFLIRFSWPLVRGLLQIWPHRPYIVVDR